MAESVQVPVSTKQPEAAPKLSPPVSHQQQVGYSNALLVRLAADLRVAGRLEAKPSKENTDEWLTGSRELKGSDAPSRPADPGDGAGVDVIVILREGTQDTQSSKDYIRGLRAYVTSVLKAPHVVDDVDALEDMFEKLDDLARRFGRIRRIRIIGHGLPTGAVGVHDKGPNRKIHWMTPREVMTFASDPEHRKVVKRVMAPGAVVEFWACSIGRSDQALSAWATLFQSRVTATIWKIANKNVVWPIPAGNQPGKRWSEFAKEHSLDDSLAPRHPDGTINDVVLCRAARSVKEIDAFGPAFGELFRQFMAEIWKLLVREGRIPGHVGEPLPGDVRNLIELFDQFGGFLPVGYALELPGVTDPYWNEPSWSWRRFEPIKGAEPSQEAPPRKPPPSPAPVPPAIVKPPVAIEEAPTTVPEAAQAPPPPVHEEARTVEHEEPSTSLRPRPTETPPEPVKETPPKDVRPRQKQDKKKAPPKQLSESEWSSLHRPGVVESLGSGRWTLWNFDVASSVLKPEHQGALDEIAKSLQTTGQPSSAISIEGQASSSGSSKFNTRLGLARARAVEAGLRRRTASMPVMNVSGHVSTTRPTKTDPEGMARDRCVDIQVGTPAQLVPPSREPLPRPVSEDRLNWADSDLERKPEQGVTNYLPGFSIEGKRIFSPDAGRIPLGTDFLLIVEGELGVKLEFKTAVPLKVVRAFKEGKWNTQIKATLHKFVFTGDIKEGKVAVQFKGLPLEPEGEIGIANLLKEPDALRKAITEDPKKLFKLATLKFTVPLPKQLEVPEFDLGDLIAELKGIQVKFTVTPKVLLSLAPSPALIARLAVSLGSRLGPVAGPIAGGAAIAAAWMLLSLHLINEAHKRGQRWADVVNFRRGYARRLAAEVADWRPGQPPSNLAWNKARREMDPEGYYRPYDYRQSYDGWQAADDAIRRLPPDFYDAGMKRARQTLGTDFKKLEEEIFKRIGGISSAPIRLPANPTLID